jgi:hypothetical protein
MKRELNIQPNWCANAKQGEQPGVANDAQKLRRETSGLKPPARKSKKGMDEASCVWF